MLLLHEPTKVTVVETATAAISVWRKASDKNLPLILFSGEPFLEPVPKQLSDQVAHLIREGTGEQISEKAVDITPNPLLLHRMAVSAALDNDLFSEIIWVLPGDDDAPLPPRTLAEKNLMTHADSQTLTLEGGGYSGMRLGKPITITRRTNLPNLDRPAWVHFDLSYFKPTYRNEVSTPLYPLVISTLKTIREARISTFGTTISLSNLGGMIALKVRFLGFELAHLLQHPESLDQPLPELQARRAQNLYLEQFFKTAEIAENTLKMETLAPNDAAVKYDLYLVHRTLKQGNRALVYLNQAVSLDPMYAYEYFYLAETAASKNRYSAALEMLENAKVVFTDNPVIPRMQADIYLTIQNRSKALETIEQLKTLPWSAAYDPDMPAQLKYMEDIAHQLPQNEQKE